MKRGLTFGILGLAGVIGLNAKAPAADREKLDHQEIGFLKDRAQDDIMMWKLGEYAAEHAATDRVRNLGKAIVEERRTDLRDIQKIAQDHDADIKVPDSMDAKQKFRFDQLSRRPGVSFDRDYTKDLVRDYDTIIPQLKRERDQAGHVDVREYAGRNVKMFEDHLKETHDAEKEVWK